MDGKLAVGLSNKVHKCQLSVTVKAYPDLHMDTSIPLVCNKYIETFYGSFTDTCSYHGKVVLNSLDHCCDGHLHSIVDLPHIDLVYYFSPMSELDNLDFVNSSIGVDKLQFIRIITVSLRIPKGEERLVRSCIYSMLVMTV